MSSEPVYEYVKGKGWIATSDEAFTGVKYYNGRAYQVTVVKRAPVLNERGWFVPKTASLKDAFDWVSWFNNDNFGWVCDEGRQRQIKGINDSYDVVYTVFTVLL